MAKLVFKKITIGDNAYAIKRNGVFIADFWPGKKGLYATARNEFIKLSASELRAIADKLDALNAELNGAKG